MHESFKSEEAEQMAKCYSVCMYMCVWERECLSVICVLVYLFINVSACNRNVHACMCVSICVLQSIRENIEDDRACACILYDSLSLSLCVA